MEWTKKVVSVVMTKFNIFRVATTDAYGAWQPRGYQAAAMLPAPALMLIRSGTRITTPPYRLLSSITRPRDRS